MGRSRNAMLRAQQALTEDELALAEAGREATATPPGDLGEDESGDEPTRNGRADE